ncbi:MAG: tetrahydromethanopterin S-methyltransferase subunit A [Methanobacterium sp. BRmetb2]|nr:MAG: tetrahydromethanopterin S-methyltransferase subunit A [Methanobacterium sp. BRmetb2]
MVEKKKPADGWPVINGDYIVGDPQSCVAGATLASHIESILTDVGAAIAGPVKTENLGVEKMIGNLISNPNIRFLILCGSEVQGHITGQSIEALHANGVDEKSRIVGATGAIPFIENMPEEAIERFQQQMEIINMIDVEDVEQIQSTVKEYIEKDAGAFEEETMVIELEEDKEEKNLKSEPETTLLFIKKRKKSENT